MYQKRVGNEALGLLFNSFGTFSRTKEYVFAATVNILVNAANPITGFKLTQRQSLVKRKKCSITYPMNEIVQRRFQNSVKI